MRSVFIIICFQFFISCNNQHDNQIVTQPSVESIDTTFISEIYYSYFDIEETSLSDVILYDENDNTIMLSELVNNKPVIILYVTESSCFDCVSKQLEYYKNFTGDSTLPLILISSSDSLRGIYSMLLQKGLDLRLYSSRYSNFGIIDERHPGPFFFVLDKSLMCKFCFEPAINSMDLTSTYFVKARAKFFR